MSLIVSNKGGSNIPPLDPGAYIAICIGVVDLGLQHNERYNKDQHKILLTFEVCDEFVDSDGEQKPRWLSKTYTSSLNEKSTLYSSLTAWRGRSFTEEELEGFDIRSMIGESCQIQVLVNKRDNGGEYNDIQAIFGLPRGVKPRVPISELFAFDMDEPDTYPVLEKIPAWIKERVEKSVSWMDRNANQSKMDMDEEPGKAAAEEDKPSFWRK